jgi:hypothetical protein
MPKEFDQEVRTIWIAICNEVGVLVKAMVEFHI